MAYSKVAILAIILASAFLVPAESAWQDKLRAANQNRIQASGALAIVTMLLPMASVPQVHDATTNNETTKFNKTSPWDDSCLTKQGCIVQYLCILALTGYIAGLIVTLVLSSMPDQMGDKCLLDHP